MIRPESFEPSTGLAALGNSGVACLDENVVLAFALGDLCEADLAAAERHVRTCRLCALLIAEAARFLATDECPMTCTGGPSV